MLYREPNTVDGYLSPAAGGGKITSTQFFLIDKGILQWRAKGITTFFMAVMSLFAALQLFGGVYVSDIQREPDDTNAYHRHYACPEDQLYQRCRHPDDKACIIALAESIVARTPDHLFLGFVTAFHPFIMEFRVKD